MSIDWLRGAVLFLPASDPRKIDRARESGADLVILDLEDAVKPEDKDLARETAIEAIGQPWQMPVGIRINGPKTEWHPNDIVAIMSAKPDFIVVPRAEGKEEIAFVRNQTGKPVAAMIETAKGLVEIHQSAREASALIAGTNDLAADLRLPGDAGRGPLQMALQSIVVAARAADIAVIDGVFNRLDDPDGFAGECAESRRLGFDGKSLIHPDQVGPCRTAFAPSAEEIARAERLVAAATGGAERFEGAMIERMHVESAERLLQRR